MVVASPNGGEAPLDPGSAKMFGSDPVCSAFLKENQSLFKQTKKLSEALPEVSTFDAVFYVGGHGRTYFAPPPQL